MHQEVVERRDWIGENQFLRALNFCMRLPGPEAQQLATYIGFICAGISAVAILVVIVLRLTGSQAFFGQASTLIAVLFLGGVQLISLGIVGEYLGRIYDEVKDRPLYILREQDEESDK